MTVKVIVPLVVMKVISRIPRTPSWRIKGVGIIKYYTYRGVIIYDGDNIWVEYAYSKHRMKAK